MEKIQNKRGLDISQIGLGTMSMGRGAMDEKVFENGVQTIRYALDHGVNYINTADFYNHGLSEMITGGAMKGYRREDVFISLKFGSMLHREGMYYGIDVRPIAVENALCYSLNRLHTDYVDLYQPCRVNPNIPIEDTFGAIAKMKEKGMVRHVGITEVDADTLEKANAVCPIDLLEVEYSLLNRTYEPTIRKARELGIGIVCFNSLLSGFIGGRHADEKLGFFRRLMKPEVYANLEAASAAFPELTKIANAKGITLAQLAMAWVKAQGSDIVVLVGSRTVEQMESSLAVADITISDDELSAINSLIPAEKANCSYMLETKLDKEGYFV